MPSLEQKYTSLTKLVQDSLQINWEEGDRNPVIDLMVTAEHIPDICSLMECACITESVVDGVNQGTDTTNVIKFVGRTVSLEVQLPAPKDNIAIVKDLNSLLSHTKFLTTVPQTVFFIDDKTSEIPISYSDTVAFANLLKRVSDHYDVDDDRLTCLFYDGVKVIIPVSYTAEEARELEGIKDLQDSFIAPRLQERIRILRSSVIKAAIAAPSENATFSHLLCNFKKVKTTFNQDWNLYVSDFSLDEVLEELEGKILSIADKLSSSLADLQKTMITIPLAIIFAAPRIETANIQTATNGIIVASVWIFALFTWTFFANHKRTLRFIIDEIEEQKTLAKGTHSGVADNVKEKFDGLKTRGEYQHTYRKAIGSLMWVAVIGITALYISPQLKALAALLYAKYFI